MTHSVHDSGAPLWDADTAVQLPVVGGGAAPPPRPTWDSQTTALFPLLPHAAESPIEAHYRPRFWDELTQQLPIIDGPSGGGAEGDPPAPDRLGRWQRLVAALPTGRVGRQLAFMALVDSTGTGAFLAISVVFLTRAVGLSVGTVAIGLSIGGAIALLTALPVGGLADRYGPRRVLVLITIWRAVCYSAYAFVTGPVSFFVVVIVLSLVDRAAGPIVQALVGQVVSGDERVRTMAVMRALRNAGFTVGALLGAVALASDNRWAYSTVLLVNGLSFAGVAIIAVRLPAVTRDSPAHVRRPISFSVLKDRPYATLAAMNSVLTLHMPLLSMGIPLWITTRTQAPTSLVAPLLAVNTILAVLLQVRFSRGSESASGAARSMSRAGIALGICCGLLAVVPPLSTWAAVAVLVLGMLALTAGELYQSAGGWGLSYELAKEGQHSAYLSVFWLGLSVQQIAAPLLMGAIIGQGATAWLLLGAAITITGLAVPAVTRWALRVRRGGAPAAPATP